MRNYELPIALIDLDGVCADFDAEVHRRMQEDHPDVQKLDPLPDPPSFYVAEQYPPEHYSLVRSLSDEAGFFASLPTVDGTIEGIEQVMRAGFRPQICSSPIRTNPHCEREKLGWVEEHLAPVLGSWIVQTAIITRDKFRVSGSVLIDDRPALQHADKASWEHVIFDRPCNRSVKRPHARLRGWHDPDLRSALRSTSPGRKEIGESPLRSLGQRNTK